MSFAEYLYGQKEKQRSVDLSKAKMEQDQGRTPGLVPDWFLEYLKQKEESEPEPSDLRRDALRKRRGQKGLFTKCSNKLHELEAQRKNNDTDQIRERILVQFEKLSKIFNQIEKCQEIILENGDVLNVPDDEEFNEIEEQEEELNTWEAKIRSMKRENEDRRQRHHESDEESDDRSSTRSEREKYSLLSLNFNSTKEIKRFDGEAMAYRTFKTSWKFLDEKMTKMDKSKAEKLIELKRNLGKEPLQLIEGLPDLNENYDPALAILEEIYMDNGVYAETILNKLFDSPKMSDEKTSLKEGYLTIVQARQILNGLMLSKEQIGDLLFTAHCERKLSPQVRKTWERMKTKSKDVSHPMGYSCGLDDLLQLLKENMKLHEKLDHDVQKKSSRDDVPRTEKNHPKGGIAKGQPSLPSSYGTKEKKKKCDICKRENHFITQCKNLKDLKTSDRLKLIREENRCYLCFETHRVTKCPFKEKWSCKLCKKQHNALLHLEDSGSNKLDYKSKADKSHTTKEQTERQESQPSKTCITTEKTEPRWLRGLIEAPSVS